VAISEELIRQGLTRVFTRYCDRAIGEQRERLEDEARAARRRLWSMADAIPTWEFRTSRRWRPALCPFSANLPMAWQ